MNEIESYWRSAWDNTEVEFRQRLGDDGFAQPFRSANPRRPEDKAWWYQNGIEMFKNWIDWREREQWAIWTLPSGEPAIELTMNIELDGVKVKMTLDRVMVTPTGELIVVDVKTGARTPTSTLQLGFYAVGIEVLHGVRPALGAYWMARKKDVTPPVSLDFYTVERLTKLVGDFDKARKNKIFMPNLSHCNLCGYKNSCDWYEKKEGLG